MQAQVSDLSAQINHMETDATLANLRHMNITVLKINLMISQRLGKFKLFTKFS